jgi:hypothetical protein
MASIPWTESAYFLTKYVDLLPFQNTWTSNIWGKGNLLATILWFKSYILVSGHDHVFCFAITSTPLSLPVSCRAYFKSGFTKAFCDNSVSPHVTLQTTLFHWFLVFLANSTGAIRFIFLQQQPIKIGLHPKVWHSQKRVSRCIRSPMLHIECKLHVMRHFPFSLSFTKWSPTIWSTYKTDEGHTKNLKVTNY